MAIDLVLSRGKNVVAQFRLFAQELGAQMTVANIRRNIQGGLVNIDFSLQRLRADEGPLRILMKPESLYLVGFVDGNGRRNIYPEEQLAYPGYWKGWQVDGPSDKKTRCVLNYGNIEAAYFALRKNSFNGSAAEVRMHMCLLAVLISEPTRLDPIRRELLTATTGEVEIGPVLFQMWINNWSALSDRNDPNVRIHMRDLRS